MSSELSKEQIRALVKAEVDETPAAFPVYLAIYTLEEIGDFIEYVQKSDLTALAKDNIHQQIRAELEIRHIPRRSGETPAQRREREFVLALLDKVRW